MDCYNIIRKEELSVASWSGGTTTQLAIWPEDALYTERNFVWRVSTARVEDMESEFTFLPGVTRCIMILEGELQLIHEGQYETFLERFSQDNFEGGWKSRSRGKVTDFNLMTTDGEGRVQVVELPPGIEQYVSLMPLAAPWGMVSEVFYLVEGTLSIRLGGEEDITLNAGDVMIRLCDGNARSLDMTVCGTSCNTAYLIRAIIYHN